jgi:hypothetical protein
VKPHRAEKWRQDRTWEREVVNMGGVGSRTLASGLVLFNLTLYHDPSMSFHDVTRHTFNRNDVTQFWPILQTLLSLSSRKGEPSLKTLCYAEMNMNIVIDSY